MQFALESYLIPMETVLGPDSIAMELATKPQWRQQLGKMWQALCRAAVTLWDRFITGVRRFIDRFRSKDICEYDDYIEEEFDDVEPKVESMSFVDWNDKLIKSALETSRILSSNLAEICRLVYGPSNGERQVMTVNGMRNDVLGNNLPIFENELKTILEIKGDNKILSASVQTMVCKELANENDKAQSIKDKLNQYYDKMQPGDNWVDNEMIKLMPQVNKALTEYAGNVNKLIACLLTFIPVKK
ncbi:MAG: hypothetical protein NC548_05360 [Lachnospiraceae bacterium]|nr:hypothetical protein [Lachnospiraceae bacterium]